MININGIEFSVDNKPKLDPGFIPLAKYNHAFLKTAKKPIAIAIKRLENQVSVYDTFIHGTPKMRDADCYYIDRLIKTLLWIKGGYSVSIYGDIDVYRNTKRAYSPEGLRSFDYIFMSRIFERTFEVCNGNYSEKPENNEISKSIGGHLDGCRIGFDAGGSDIKVSAVIDGISVFSKEIVWLPKVQTNPDYHYEKIVDALKIAASYMPRVDAIGISSAGIYIDNRTMVASLFLKVPRDLFDEKAKDIYIQAAKAIGDVPVVVCNDGDVSALAGCMSLNEKSILGIAMGTSEAAGFINEQGNITGWLNELSFAPVDAQADAVVDEWSGDIGCGVNYFSQDAVIRLAPKADIRVDQSLTPAKKLAEVQRILEKGSKADSIFETIGVYLGHTIAYYYDFYDCKHVLLLGRVMSGRGGELIIQNAKHVLKSEYTEISKKINVVIPDEKMRRLGQSVAAASLPEI